MLQSLSREARRGPLQAYLVVSLLAAPLALLLATLPVLPGSLRVSAAMACVLLGPWQQLLAAAGHRNVVECVSAGVGANFALVIIEAMIMVWSDVWFPIAALTVNLLLGAVATVRVLSLQPVWRARPSSAMGV